MTAGLAVGEFFDQEAPRLAAVFYLPVPTAAARSIRQVIVKSGAGLLKESGDAVAPSSRKPGTKRRPSARRSRGRVDLLLENPPLVIDLKGW
ncbi:MAG: hypothetical protein IPF82_24190 [Blastocatellia bacterium]|nr:hypothetical protein [Blastocatellia bacterium]